MDKNNRNLKLNIIQWNAQSIKSKILSFQNILVQEKIHIAAVSETWLDSNTILKLKDYNIFRADRSDSYGGVALFVHKSIKAEQMVINDLDSSIEMVGINLFNCGVINNVISLYCPPSACTTQRMWENLFSILNKKSLILGDFNGHHTNWSTKIDTRGSQIFEALIDHPFTPLNDGRPTRIRLVNGALQQSAPDISLASTDIFLKLNWNTINETLGSDHLLIKIT